MLLSLTAQDHGMNNNTSPYLLDLLNNNH